MRSLFRMNGLSCGLEKFGLEVVDIIDVDIDKCFYQRPVLCEMLPVDSIKTIDFLENYFLNSSGQKDWSIKNSMHCLMYNSFLNNQFPQKLDDLDYWKWHSYLDRNQINSRPPQWIKIKVGKAIDVLKSIKEKGFISCNIHNLAWVVREPICLSRYGLTHKISGYEIYSGHHRIAALSSLGISKVRVIVVKDVAKFTPFGIPLSKINK
jgi:hypothetical protein